jgi:transcriptional regulator with XRE-family HTH domain
MHSAEQYAVRHCPEHTPPLNCCAMRVTSSAGKPRASADDGDSVAKRAPSLKEIRRTRGLTQQNVAELCGMHRNSILNIENGKTREITEENAVALSNVLGIRPEELGLHIRRPTVEKAPSLRFRELSAEQRQLVDELLSLPLEDLSLVREAVADLRKRRSKRRRRKGGR